MTDGARGQTGDRGRRPGAGGHHRALAQHPVAHDVGVRRRRPGHHDLPLAGGGRRCGGGTRGGEVGRGRRHRRRGRRPVAVAVHRHHRVGVGDIVDQPGVGERRPTGDRGDLHAVPQHPVGSQVGLAVRRPRHRHLTITAHRVDPGRGGRRGQVGRGRRHRRRGRRPVAVAVHRHHRVGVGDIVDQPGVGERRPTGDRGDLHAVPQHPVGSQVGLAVRRPRHRHLTITAHRVDPGRGGRRGQVGRGRRHRRRGRRPVAVAVHRHHRVRVGDIVDQPGVGERRPTGDRGDLHAVPQHPVGSQVGLAVRRPRHRHLTITAHRVDPGRGGRRGQVGRGRRHRVGDRRGVAVGVHGGQPVGVGDVVGHRGVGVAGPGDGAQQQPVAVQLVPGQVGLGVRRPAQVHPALPAHGGEPGGRGRRGQVRGGGVDRRAGGRLVGVVVHSDQLVAVGGVVDQPGVGERRRPAGHHRHLHTVAQDEVGGQVGLDVGHPGQRHAAVTAGGREAGGGGRGRQVRRRRGHGGRSGRSGSRDHPRPPGSSCRWCR